MTTSLRWTSVDLELLPDDGKRYEIIDGELHVSKQPHWHRQFVCGRIFRFLDEWNDQTGAGVVDMAPGIIFADDEDVAPDVIWISNERRDREARLKLYSQRGVHEYWIVDWRQRQVEVFRREQAVLQLQQTLFEQDMLRSPSLPDFACQVGRLFAGVPRTE